MNQSTIIHLPPNQLPAKAFLEEALVKFPTVQGFALRYEGELVHENEAKVMSCDDLMTVLEGAKDDHRVVFLGNWPVFQDVSDVPPYVMMDGDGNPLLAMFYEGDFAGFENMNGKHVAEYNLSDELIFPRLEKAFKDADSDPEKFFELLRGEAIKKTFSNAYKHRGVFCFLPKIGDPITFGDNAIGAQYSWGNVSNVASMKYTEAKAAPASGGGGGTSFLNRIRAGVGMKPAEPAPEQPQQQPQPQPQPQPTQPAGPVANPDPKVEIKSETKLNLVEVQCPPKLTGGAKNYWLRTFNGKNPGELPPNHQSNKVSVWVEPGLLEFAKRDVSTTKDVRKLADDIKAKSGNVVDMRKPITTAENGGKSTVREKAPTSETPVSDYLPVLDTKDKERCMFMMADFLSVKKRPTPMEIQKLESKWPTFSDEIGVKFNELLFITIDQVMKLFDGNKIAACAFIEMRRKYIEGSGIKLEDLVQGSAKPEEGAAAQVEVSSGEPKTAEAKKAPPSGLSFLRRTA